MTRALRLLFGCALVATLAGGAQADDSIYDIQQGSFLPGTPVIVDSVVVTGVFFNGFHAQEPDLGPFGRQFGGIWCFTGGSPTVSRGDLVNLEGNYDEFFDESEILLNFVGANVTVIGAQALPPFVNVAITDVYGSEAWAEVPVAYSGALAENYEGVLVEVTLPNMVATDTLRAGCASMSPTRWGVYQTSAPSDTLFVRNSVASHAIPPDIMPPITFIQGAMAYHQCMRKIMPRDNDDVGFVNAPNVLWAYSTSATTVTVEFNRDVDATSAANTGNYFFLSGLTVMGAARDGSDFAKVNLTTTAQSNILDDLTVLGIIADGGVDPMPSPETVQFWTNITAITDVQFVVDPGTADASPKNGDVVTVVGVATSSTIGTATSDFFMQDAAGAWNGIRINFAGTNVDIGDNVLAAATVTETFGQTELSFAGFAYSENQGAGTPVTPALVTPSTLPYASISESEQYEGVLVRIEGAEIDTTDFWQSGEWFLFDPAPLAPGDSAKFDHRTGGVDDVVFDLNPCVGDIVDVQGPVRYSFNEYNIIPRTIDDFVRVTPNPAGCIVATGEVVLPISMRLKNHPNPFNPQTTITFMMPQDGEVSLEIFDIRGRRVRSLLTNTVIREGQNTAEWDGRDDHGKDVSSGTYFYRVTLGKEVVTNRMTLLK